MLTYNNERTQRMYHICNRFSDIPRETYLQTALQYQSKLKRAHTHSCDKIRHQDEHNKSLDGESYRKQTTDQRKLREHLTNSYQNNGDHQINDRRQAQDQSHIQVPVNAKRKKTEKSIFNTPNLADTDNLTTTDMQV